MHAGVSHGAMRCTTTRAGARVVTSGTLSVTVALCQEAIAHEAGLTVSAYARTERGEVNPTWSAVTELARALGSRLPKLGKAVETMH